ncbi:hypothetical protein JNW88_15045 [Micromonospora sp. ATA32]|nr:hypothetical protein [Micromonospora sp. ATA32]
MARRKNSSTRQALILAFWVGALTGAAGALTLRRRRQAGDIPAGDVAGHLGDTASPPPGRRFDKPSQGSVKTPEVQQG